MQSNQGFHVFHKAPPAITFVQENPSESSTSSNMNECKVGQRNCHLTRRSSGYHLSPDHCGDFVSADGSVSSGIVLVATETEILLPGTLSSSSSGATNQSHRAKDTLEGSKNIGASCENAKNDCDLQGRDITTIFMPHGTRYEKQRSTAPEVKVKSNPAPRVLIVGDEDSGLTDHVDFHLRELDNRMSRDDDDMQAMRIFKRPHRFNNNSDDRERYYKRKHLLAWQAAITMPRTKKTPFETDIPLAATSLLRKRLPKRERIRRRILQAFGCCQSKRRYVDEFLTQVSVDNFNARYDHMKAEDFTLGFGIQRRTSIFSTTHPKFIEYDEPDY